MGTIKDIIKEGDLDLIPRAPNDLIHLTLPATLEHDA
jgi:hypothetical protein